MAMHDCSISIPVGARLPASRTDHSDAAPPPAKVDAAVIGAGVIGLSIAWRLACRRLSIAVFDRASAGSGASLAATGMLAAAAEHEPGGEDLLALGLDSQALWPDFRAALQADADMPIGYRDEGTLLVALGRDEVERLRFRYEQQQRVGLETRWLSGSEARAREPGLRGSAAAGIFCPRDHQVDPRRLIPALAQALRRRGGHLVENCAVTALDSEGGHARGVVTPRGRCAADLVILAGGAWSADLLPTVLDIPLRPLKGQALALRMTRRTGVLRHVVWTEQVHLAPKDGGELIVGATVEEAGFDPAITAGGALALLDGVHRAFPASEEMPIEAIWSGFRPTSDDDAPILGDSGIPGLLIATGHHRNGILLAPATAHAIETLVTSGSLGEAAARFSLARFRKPASVEIVGATT